MEEINTNLLWQKTRQIHLKDLNLTLKNTKTGISTTSANHTLRNTIWATIGLVDLSVLLDWILNSGGATLGFLILITEVSRY